MRVHHLNCISTCPLGGRLMDGRTQALAARGELCCHCLLVETADSLVLVDTGLGMRDVLQPRTRLSRFFLALVHPDLRAEMTAVRQIQRLGFRPQDVRHILLSHLDFDHAGGLDDFPHARVHMLERERTHAQRQHSWLDRQRFRPQQWSSAARWHTYDSAQGDAWMGFDCVRALEGVPPELLLVPLPGHTHGHAGIALDSPSGWLFLAADAYFHADEMHTTPECPPGLRAYQWMMELDRPARLHNQHRLRELRHRQTGMEFFCSHDVSEFERLSGRSAGVPVPRTGSTQAA